MGITDIWGNHNYDDYKNNFVASSFCKLYMLEVNHCSKLESVIPHAMLHRLRNLEKLDVSHCRGLRNAFPCCIARDLIHLRQLRFIRCGMMREIIRGGEREEEEIIVFPELKELELVDLKNLTSFWCYQSGESSTYTYTYKVHMKKYKKNTRHWKFCSLITNGRSFCRFNSQAW